MKRILFSILWVIAVFGNTPARGAVEIFVNGHKYNSIEEYQASERSAMAQSPSIPASLSSQEENDILKEAQQLGVKVDLSKVKTLQVDQKDLSDTTRHKLYVLSVEHGMVDAMKDFYQSWGQGDFHVPYIISSEQLQDAIQHAVSTSKNPKLLIATPGKVRIMAMTAQDTNK